VAVLIFSRVGRNRYRTIGVALVAMAAVTAWYIPSYIWHRDVLQDLTPYAPFPFSAVGHIGRIAYKLTYFVGPFAAIIGVLAAVRYGRSVQVSDWRKLIEDPVRRTLTLMSIAFLITFARAPYEIEYLLPTWTFAVLLIAPYVGRRKNLALLVCVAFFAYGAVSVGPALTDSDTETLDWSSAVQAGPIFDEFSARGEWPYAYKCSSNFPAVMRVLCLFR
jgi:hypothetical protein